MKRVWLSGLVAVVVACVLGLDPFVAVGQTSRVSVSSVGTEGNDGSSDPVLSADGRYVAFESGADNLVPGDLNGSQDVFVSEIELFRGIGIQITGTSSNIVKNVLAGDAVEFAVHTYVRDNAPVEYRFFVRGGYGEPDWGGNKWQIVQPYSPNNTVTHTFDVPGIYFLVGHVIYPGDTWVFGYPQSGIVVEVWPAR
jgi:hypothetical protein